MIISRSAATFFYISICLMVFDLPAMKRRSENFCKDGLERSTKRHRNDVSLNKSLITATKKGNISEVCKLLDEGAFIDSRNGFGDTPLMIAAKRALIPEYFEITNLLLDKGASVEVTNNNEQTVLFFSSKLFGNVKIVRSLLDRGVLPNFADNYLYTPLMEACFYGRDDIAEELLRNEANATSRNDYGNTALMIAVDNLLELLESLPGQEEYSKITFQRCFDLLKKNDNQWKERKNIYGLTVYDFLNGMKHGAFVKEMLDKDY